MSMKKYSQSHYVHFITFTTSGNREYFKDGHCCLIFLKVLKRVRKKLRFKLRGYCIMPDHTHLLIEPYLGANEFAPTREGNGQSDDFFSTPGRSDFNRTDISYIAKRIKGASARMINKYLKEKGTFWQKDFYDFPIYSDHKYEQKLTYIHNNPVPKGLVQNLDDYPYSSYQNYFLENDSLIELDLN